MIWARRKLHGSPITSRSDGYLFTGAQVVTITGPDQHNLLLRLTGALNSLDLNVVSASISSSEDGNVFDVFRISNREDQKVRPGRKAAPCMA